MGRSKDNAGSWLLTYSDFMTLLMIFFIVLYTLTPGIEEEKFNSIMESFQGNRSVLESGVAPRRKMTLAEKRERNWEKLQEFIEQNKLSNQVEVSLLKDGVKITLGQDFTFDSGSARLLRRSKTILKEIVGRLKAQYGEKVKLVEVLGHTDDVPISSGRKYMSSNWQLGALRATSVLQFLVDNSDIEEQLFRATSLGKYHPRRSNDTAEGRRKNRRVEIIVRYEEDKQQDEAVSADTSEAGKRTGIP